MKIDFDYSLIAYKGDKYMEFDGDSCLTDFGKIDKDGLTKIGWSNGDGETIVANLIDGSFDLNGFELFIDLGLLGKDAVGNVRAVPISELKLEPIWFRRVRQDYAPDGITTTVKYCIGWKARYEGKVSQKIAILDSFGGVTISDRK